MLVGFGCWLLKDNHHILGITFSTRYCFATSSTCKAGVLEGRVAASVGPWFWER